MQSAGLHHLSLWLCTIRCFQRDGDVEFKTDNRGLFEYSLASIPDAGWRVREYTFDLHNSPMAEGNVMTEYEEKFSSRGQAICKLSAVRDK